MSRTRTAQAVAVTCQLGSMWYKVRWQMQLAAWGHMVDRVHHTGWTQHEANGIQCGSWGSWVSHQLEPKASQAALGCMMGFALNFKHRPLGRQGHPGKMLAQVVALQRLMDKQCLEKDMWGFLPYFWSFVLP